MLKRQMCAAVTGHNTAHPHFYSDSSCVCVCPCLHVRQSGDSSVFPKFVHKPKGLLEACWCPLLAKKISTFNLDMAAFY